MVILAIIIPKSAFFNWHEMNEISGFNSQMAGGVISPTNVLQFLNNGNATWLWSATEQDEESASVLC